MKKDLGIIFGLFFFLAALIIFGKGFTSTSFLGSGESTKEATVIKKDVVDVIIRDLVITTKVANTNKLREKGLSKQESMALNWGMLFVFEKNSPWAFWMKDMKFAIDIIWIDENKKIVHIFENVSPEPRKKDKDLIIYKPPVDSRYVLEINAGLAKLHNIQPGDPVDF